LVDSDDERDLEMLLDGQPSKKRVLCAAGSSTFIEHRQWVCGAKVPAVGHTMDVRRRFPKVLKASGEESSRDRPGRFQNGPIERFPTIHGTHLRWAVNGKEWCFTVSPQAKRG
jgi:hypothetical protein